MLCVVWKENKVYFLMILIALRAVSLELGLCVTLIIVFDKVYMW